MITRVGQNSAEADNVTIPAGHKVGDLMIIFAFRDGSATWPSLPAGWTNITSGTATGVSIWCGYKICTSSSETSGTWTNATGVMVVVLRGCNNDNPIIATNANGNASSTAISYPSLNSSSFLGINDAYLIAFAGHMSTNTTTMNVLTGMTNIINALGSTQDMVAFEKVVASIWNGATQETGGTASGTFAVVVAVRKASISLNNYNFVRVGDGMSTSERIR